MTGECEGMSRHKYLNTNETHSLYILRSQMPGVIHASTTDEIKGHKGLALLIEKFFHGKRGPHNQEEGA